MLHHLSMNKVKVVAGEIPIGTYILNTNDYHAPTLRSPTGRVINLKSEQYKLIQVNQENKESAKSWLLAYGGAAAGLLLLGPWAALVGLLACGNVHRVCATFKLADDTDFMASMSSRVFEKLLAIKMEIELDKKRQIVAKPLPMTATTEVKPWQQPTPPPTEM